ncbi:HPF/RaiA family ribosome-associated protein [Tautonia sociabilis]|uniref:Ribosome-associated translation inhibitor RaiA n=1 Tax=Tautonia sociabilis TaxID=2080755 RepID=A0A432MHR3_9BACT|nr:HPF/RaiA family ribosome-associated protein [Tautonia sociabilis]RUL86855.1 ribosome-associated translation inhibitor RaiA [Tautonia sociabilis]
MQIELSTRHGLTLDPSQQRYVQDKAGKLLKYFNRLMAIEVIIDHQKNGWWMEMVASAEHKHDFVARGDAPGLEAVTDQVVHMIEQQIRRYKDRIQDHRDEMPHGGTSPTRPDLPEPPASTEPPRES